MLSPKQQELFKSIREGHDVIIADGPIRSGKTFSAEIGLILAGIAYANGRDCCFAGRTISSVKRNMINPIIPFLKKFGIKTEKNYGESYVDFIAADGKVRFYLFGGDKVTQADPIYGLSLFLIGLDEATRVVKEIIEALKSRMTYDDSLFMMMCNPDRPKHQIKEEFIDGNTQLNVKRIKFTIEDNPSLGQKTIERLKRLYPVGSVFHNRLILGLWVAAEGMIYVGFNKENVLIKEFEENYIEHSCGVDIGGTDATIFSFVGFTHNFDEVHSISTKYHKNKVDGLYQKDYEDYVNDFIDWARELKKQYPKWRRVFVDSADKLFRLNLQKKCNKAGLNLKIYPSYKADGIEDRIRMEQILIAQDRLKIYYKNEQLIEAFEDALWDENQEDKGKLIRLDDGTSDIDSLDAFEYAINPYKLKLIKEGDNNVDSE